ITQAETLYYWKAKARDPSGTNEWSGWSETRSFVMDMEIGIDYPYWYQVAGPQFEQCERESVKVVDDSVLISEYETTIDEGFEGSFLPAGWDTLNRGESSNEWSRASDRVYSGSYSVKISFDSKDTVDVWLVTDTLNLSSVASCTLSFWGQDNYASDYSYHGIWASTTSQTNTNTFSEVQQINATAEDTWEKSTVNLSSYVGNSSVYVAFRYEEINGTEWWVDDITVKSVYTNPPGGGYLLSPPIVYQDLKTEDYNRNSWDGVKWTKSRASDSIGMQIEYKHNGPWTLVPDNAIGAQGGDSNSTGFFDLDTNFCTVDLSNLTPNTYDTLRIKALFGKGTTKASSNPALYMWA
ncbi:choice-of-anchor J domain-containing protein, partial [candidate division WOR-3 bacterium]|nr:choice-of-anchor J domain-containing protein [candidate division WOR-3 bacterium]